MNKSEPRQIHTYIHTHTHIPILAPKPADFSSFVLVFLGVDFRVGQGEVDIGLDKVVLLAYVYVCVCVCVCVYMLKYLSHSSLCESSSGG